MIVAVDGKEAVKDMVDVMKSNEEFTLSVVRRARYDSERNRSRSPSRSRRPSRSRSRQHKRNRSRSRTSDPPEQLRRSARLDPNVSTELRQLVDHRLSRLKSEPQKPTRSASLGPQPASPESSQRVGDSASQEPPGVVSPASPDAFYDWLGGDAPTPDVSRTRDAGGKERAAVSFKHSTVAQRARTL